MATKPSPRQIWIISSPKATPSKETKIKSHLESFSGRFSSIFVHSHRFHRFENILLLYSNFETKVENLFIQFWWQYFQIFEISWKRVQSNIGLSSIRIGTQESLMGLKTPKLSRVPQCGRPTGLDMGGIHRWDQNQAKTWLRVNSISSRIVINKIIFSRLV